MNESLTILIRKLFALVGNKRYLNDIENLLGRIDNLTPEEDEALLLLARDLRDLKELADRKVHNNFLPFR